ncbi:hypothetical protein CMR03_19600 [Pantoea allii]|nr:hypothetical protein CMR03_19600 [Pantoea allii]
MIRCARGEDIFTFKFSDVSQCYYGYFCDNHCNIGEKIACQREFLVQDPDGYLLRFSQYIE